MKKKLLTVLLAVVMVFGVFGLTACGGSNPDEDYNYYSSKYGIEDEVKIDAATFQGVYRMFTYGGSYLLYIDTEGEGAAARFKAINELATKWGVTIYHFNPDLSGGYASDDTSKHTTNIISDLDEVATASQLINVQNKLIEISGMELNGKTEEDTYIAGWKDMDNKLIAINNNSISRYEGATFTKNGQSGQVASKADVIAAIALRKPSYAQYQENGETAVPAAYNTANINTMNCFADARLHMYDDEDKLTEEKTDVYVTVANYAMFAHLMANNDGYFAVFFGGTWCGNTQAIAKAVNDLAKDYGISKVYMFDPRLDNGTYTIGDYAGRNLNTRTSDGTGEAYCFGYLYARFLGEYLPTYESNWNYGVKLSITTNGQVVERTRMCVPNMMMFNGEGEGKAELSGLCEAEYTWANTSVEGNPQNVEWINAVKAVFDKNPYASYNPIPVIPDTGDTGSTGGSTGGNQGGSSGGDAC